MTYQEFINLLPESTHKPTDGEYQSIEYVYTWHPSIRQNEHEGQEQMIARLYSEFGMRIIYDMEGTASIMEQLNKKYCRVKNELKDIEREIAELACVEKAGELA